jgi:UDP-N-acetylglucosamine 4,6-dehydratase/5-epimerase
VDILDNLQLAREIEGKTILVIGGTGTIGQQIVTELSKYSPTSLRIFSRDEHKQFMMQNDFTFPHLRYFIGDVCDKQRVDRAMKGVHIVFHLAALKHVPAAEYNPFEAVKVNVIGTQNVIDCALENKVNRVVFTSSDKAVSPTNAMGATKLLAERLISSTVTYQGKYSPTIFCAVRFGNVLGSRGSVIPLFNRQIQKHGMVTITNPNMTRFMMTVPQAAHLTIEAALKATGGEVFVLKMPVMKLGDLADVLVNKICCDRSIAFNSVEQRVIGLRPGEKMYEELMTEDESEMAYENDTMYAIMPWRMPWQQDHEDAYKGWVKAQHKSYNSSNERYLSKTEIKEMLESEVCWD